MKKISKKELREMIENIEISILRMINFSEEKAVEEALTKVYVMLDPLLDKLQLIERKK